MVLVASQATPLYIEAVYVAIETPVPPSNKLLRMAASPIQSAEQPLAYVFLALQLTGCGVFLFMVLTALIFRSSVTRHPVWYNFCLSFIVYTLSYSLLVFSRKRNDPSELVKTDICIGQAVLVYAAPFL